MRNLKPDGDGSVASSRVFSSISGLGHSKHLERLDSFERNIEDLSVFGGENPTNKARGSGGGRMSQMIGPKVDLSNYFTKDEVLTSIQKEREELYQ